MESTTLIQHLAAHQPQMLEATQQLVEQESPSTDKPLLDALADSLSKRFQDAGADVTPLPSATHGNHVRAVFSPAEVSDARPALVLCHYDTVWPSGTLAQMPFRQQDDKAYGPGIYDMKASIVLVEWALRALSDLKLFLPRPVIALLTSDEEIGSPSSRALIEEHAREAAYVLVMEPPLPGGVLKTARKGIGRFTLDIEGRASHAGTEPEKGLSAIEELAHQIQRAIQLRDKEQGTTINVGVVRGGTRTNVVAAHATMDVDARVWTAAEAARIEAALLHPVPTNPGITLKPSGGFNRPPMERTPHIVALFERAQGVGRTLGFELKEGESGGGSDANFSAALGVPTLDGLGMPGAGAHADHEHIHAQYLPHRAALLAALLLGL